MVSKYIPDFKLTVTACSGFSRSNPRTRFWAAANVCRGEVASVPRLASSPDGDTNKWIPVSAMVGGGLVAFLA